MSFSATVDQMRDRSKTVTRRDPSTWANLKPGDRLLAVEKAMGLAKGEQQVPLGVIEIVDVRVELLSEITDVEATKEGFPKLGANGFIAEVWVPMHGYYSSAQMVRRIEFRHIDEEQP